MLADIAKALVSFVVAIGLGVYAMDGFFVGDIDVLNYIIGVVALLVLLFSFYNLNQLQSNSY